MMCSAAEVSRIDKAQWAAQKQAERKEAYELIDNTCAEMAVGGDSPPVS